MDDQPVVGATQPPKTGTDARIRKLDETDTIKPVLEHGGYTVEWSPADHRRYVPGLQCAGCGEEWNTLEDHPAVEVCPSTVGYVSETNQRVARCTICAHDERSSELFVRLVPKGRLAVLDKDFRFTRIQNQDFTAIRCNGRTCVTERGFQSGAKQVTTDNPDLLTAFEACVIQAPTLDAAIAAVAHRDFPSDVWTVVPLTHKLWPRERWHKLPMTMTDSAPIRDYQRKAHLERAKKLDNEAKDYRKALEKARA
jgi:hypothetical protein